MRASRAKITGLACLFGWLLLCPRMAASRAPPDKSLRPDVFWQALDPPKEHAPARGTQTLRAPLSGRVRIAGGSFTMGATPVGLMRALSLCSREIYERRCGELQVQLLG